MSQVQILRKSLAGSRGGRLILSVENMNNDFEGELLRDKKQPRKISLSSFIFSAVALVLAAVMLTFTVCNSFYKKQLAQARLENVIAGSELYGELELLRQLFAQYSYLGANEEELVDTVLKAYVASTGDRYAEYYNAEEFAALRADTAGESVGIGINVANSTARIDGTEYKVIEVIAVSPESPAQEAGLKVGDMIVWAGVGDSAQLVDTMGYTAALEALRGAEGTLSEFTAIRWSPDRTSYVSTPYSIVRKKVEAISVYSSVSERDSTVGIVKISQFDLTVPRQFSEAVDSLIQAGCTKFVFDVRYNPGGDLNSITAVLSYFLDKGAVILSTVDKQGNRETIEVGPVEYSGDYASCSVLRSDIGKYKDLDIAVLCNESTASAAELFTAALRDYGLATVVGKKTYGKGSMQSILSLESFGYSGGLKLTTRMYFPPCGVGYDGVGISPSEGYDVELSDEAKEYNVYLLPQSLDSQLIAAVDSFNK